MKSLFALAILTPMLAVCQGIMQPKAPDIQAQPQPAQTITIKLSADLATALESARLNIRTSITDSKTGVTTMKPVYATIQDLLENLLRSPGGVFSQIVTRFPPASVKAAAAAAAKAKTDAENAAQTVTSKPPE